MYIEFPDYSQWFKCFIFESLLRLIASVAQLNLITFVGLAEWIAETNNYRFNTEKWINLTFETNMTK